MKPNHLAVARVAALLSLCLLSAIAGMAQGGQRSQHYVFINANLHITQFYQNGTASQSVEDITTDAGAPVAASTSGGLTSYVDSFGEHVAYVASTQHVYLLYYSYSTNRWSPTDLTAVAGGALAATGSALTSYVDSFGEHVFYLSTSGHVCIFYLHFGGSPWVEQDLTAATGGTVAVSGSGLTSYVDSFGEHVAYFGTNEHVYLLYLKFGGSPWVNQDLTAIAQSGVPALAGSALTSFASGRGEEIIYQAATFHVRDLFLQFGGSPWVDLDLTTLTGAPAANSKTPLSSFSDTGGGTLGPGGEHVFYLTFQPNGADCYTGQPCNVVTEALYNGSTWTTVSIGVGFQPPLQGALASLPGVSFGSGNYDFEEVGFFQAPNVGCPTGLDDEFSLFEFLYLLTPPWRWEGCPSAYHASDGAQTQLTSFIVF
jgi:hypothetical protein